MIQLRNFNKTIPLLVTEYIQMASYGLVVMDTRDVASVVLCCWGQRVAPLEVSTRTISASKIEW